MNAAARAKFDGFAKAIAAGVEPYALRQAVVQLRKTRRLEPEWLNRVTDWTRRIRAASLEEIRADLGSLSDQAGVYLFRDAAGYLYRVFVYWASVTVTRTHASALARIRSSCIGGLSCG